MDLYVTTLSEFNNKFDVVYRIRIWKIFYINYILILFYYIFFTKEKFIFVILDNKMMIPNYKKYILLLIINIVETINMFMQGYYVPRFIFGSICKEKIILFIDQKTNY